MKHLFIIVLAAALLLTACTGARQKISPTANVALRTANMELKQGNIELALDNFEIVLAERPDHAEALNRTARIFFKQASDFPGTARENYMKAYQRLDQAIAIYESFEPLSEADRKEIKEMTDLRTSCWARLFKMGEDQELAGNTKEALELYDLVMKLDPTRDEPLKKLYGIYKDDPAKIDQAEAILLNISKKSPDDLDAIKTLGAFYYNDRKDYAKALEYYEIVKEKEPLNTNTLLLLTYCQYELGRYQDALANVQLVLQLEPENSDALSDAKSISYKLGDNEKALQYLEKMLALKEDEETLMEISFLLNSMKNYQKLVNYAEKWYEFNPSSRDAVQLIILGAQGLKNKTLEKKYSDILKKM